MIIEGIHLRFSPENAKGEKLTSRALKNECAFEFKDVLIRKEKTVDGKKKVYFEKIAVSDYALSQTPRPIPRLEAKANHLTHSQIMDAGVLSERKEYM